MNTIIAKIIEKLPEELKIAMMSGCEIETSYDKDKRIVTIKTKNRVDVIK